MRAPEDAAALDPSQAAAADAGMKAMMPFGRPFLDHVLHSFAEAGFRGVAIVLAPGHEDARAYYRAIATSRIRITLLTQAEPLGTADALSTAEAWGEGETFVTANADNLYPVEVLASLAAGGTPALAGFERDALGIPLDRLGAFALVERDARGCLSRIVEKPGEAAMRAAGPRALVSMNLWRFDARIFDFCRDVPVSVRGERELPEAVGLAASRGVCFEVIPVTGGVVDLSRRTDVAGVGRRLANAPVVL